MHPKIVATLIICGALGASTVVYEQRDSIFSQGQNQTQTGSLIATSTTSSDWRNSLSSLIGPQATGSVQVIASGQSTSEATDNTLTAQLAKQFFAFYLQDQKNGVAIDAAEAQNIADKTLASVPLTSNAKQYGLTDITFGTDTSFAAKQAYGTALADAAARVTNKSSGMELIIVSNAIQNNSSEEIAKLDPIINSYQTLIGLTLKIKVPQDGIGLHLVYINTLSDILDDLQKMRQLINDPLEGYIGFTNYQKDTVALQAVFNNFKIYLGGK